MSRLIVAPQKLFGLLELDLGGTVLFSKLEGEETLVESTVNVVGRNFFSEVVTFSNVAEFQERLESFDNGHEPTNSFIFNCDYKDGAVSVKVLLARLREDTSNPGSVLVYIKKTDQVSNTPENKPDGSEAVSQPPTILR